MSDIKYEDIYYMIKDVAYDQEDPIDAYKKIEKQIIKAESDLAYYKRLSEAAGKVIELERTPDDISLRELDRAIKEYQSILKERVK